MNKQVLIVGAGKIGRGFIAHLFYKSGYKLWFLDTSEPVLKLLNTEKRYRIDIVGENKDLTEYIDVAGAFTLEHSEQLAAILRDTEILVSSVGAANIESVAGFIKKLLITAGRSKPLNWIIAENANDPAGKIRAILLKDADPSFEAFVRDGIGLIETQILRTGMPAKEEVLLKEPLALRMQDWWTLPLDKDAFVGPVPDVCGFRPRSNFSHELIRKIYTFNGTNGPIAYIGWANGYHTLHESALAFPAFFKEIQEESAFGLIREFHLDEQEQRDFMALALKKYTDPALNDRVERNAADTRRKLGKDERLLGPALLCLRHGRTPNAYANAIAAAYYYSGSDDEGTREVQATIDREGIEKAIQKYSAIDGSNPLFDLIIRAYRTKSFIIAPL
jgi:mannitol-1-phosphate 5-dehydrogenase